MSSSDHVESVSSHCVSEAVVCHLVAMLSLLALTASVRLWCVIW